MISSKWFSHYVYNDNAKVNMFCFPQSGGSSSYFSQWQKNFSKEDVNVIPVEYPMRERRSLEPMPDSLLELAKSIATENVDAFKDKPFALFGHCTGGLIAYETAKYLSKELGVSAKYVFASSILPPEYAKVPPIEKVTCEELERLASQYSFFDRSILQNKTVLEYKDVLAYFLRYGETYPNWEFMLTNAELLEYFLPIVKADFTIHENYTVIDRTPIDVPIVCIHGANDHSIDKEVLGEWQGYTSYPLEILQYDGDHFYTETHISQLASDLQRLLIGG